MDTFELEVAAAAAQARPEARRAGAGAAGLGVFDRFAGAVVRKMQLLGGEVVPIDGQARAAVDAVSFDVTAAADRLHREVMNGKVGLSV